MQEDAQNRRHRQLRLVERSDKTERQAKDEPAVDHTRTERPPLDLTDEFHFLTR